MTGLCKRIFQLAQESLLNTLTLTFLCVPSQVIFRKRWSRKGSESLIAILFDALLLSCHSKIHVARSGGKKKQKLYTLPQFVILFSSRLFLLVTI